MSPRPPPQTETKNHEDKINTYAKKANKKIIKNEGKDGSENTVLYWKSIIVMLISMMSWMKNELGKRDISKKGFDKISFQYWIKT